MGLETLAIIGGVASAATSIHQGEKQRRAQSRALRDQQAANERTIEEAAAQQRRAEEDEERARRRAPDIASILGQERQASRTGPGSTLLTGSRGVSSGSMLLGGSTILGG